MKFSKILAVGLVFLGMGAPAYGLTDVVGKITFLDGDVRVFRDGTALPSSKVNIGTALEDYDQIQVGASGQAEISLDPKTGIGAVIRLRASTVINLDVTGLQSQQTGAIDLLAGSVNLKVQKLIGSNQFNVHTDGAVMGVRGTDFDVDTGVDGGLLLSTDEGKVEATTDEGTSYVSTPGTAVESSEEGSWGLHDVKASEQRQYREGWRAARLAAFQAHPEKAILRTAMLYKSLKERFENTFAKLEGQRSLLSQWANEDRAGQIGNIAQHEREKRKIATELVAARDLSLRMDRVLRRLERLSGLIPSGTVFKTRLQGNVSIEDFMTHFQSERQNLEDHIRQVHLAVRLYAKRNGGVMPRFLGQDSRPGRPDRAGGGRGLR